MTTQKYLSDCIGTEYQYWGKRKIIIKAPTGMGKTTFLIRKVLPYNASKKRKVLILCNRSMLRNQYDYQLIREYYSNPELEQFVDVKTYQELGLKTRTMSSDQIVGMFKKYDVVCLDECHFFRADSDFNGYGSYVLFQNIILAGISKQMIFISATAECIEEYIVEALKSVESYLKLTYGDANEQYPEWEKQKYCFRKTGYISNEEYTDIVTRDYMKYQDYDYLHCFHVPDWDTACEIIYQSNDKTVMFIDDKRLATTVENKLKTLGLPSKDIAILNASNLNNPSREEVVQGLCIDNKLYVKVLITTSVLDNGVSINDVDVKNMFILTEDKVSFLQMIGRIRKEYTDHLNLFLMSRESNDYNKRAIRCEYEIKVFDKNYNKNKIGTEFLSKILNDADEREMNATKKMYVAVNNMQEHLLTMIPNYVIGSLSNAFLIKNRFAYDKTKLLYHANRSLYVESRNSSYAVSQFQLEWLNKKPEELQCVKSSYLENKKREFIKKIESIKKLPKEELKKVKDELNKEFHKEFYPDINIKNGSLSNEKLIEILSRYNYKLISEHTENRRIIYSVQQMNNIK